jgi:hypothetical protein
VRAKLPSEVREFAPKSRADLNPTVFVESTFNCDTVRGVSSVTVYADPKFGSVTLYVVGPLLPGTPTGDQRAGTFQESLTAAAH